MLSDLHNKLSHLKADVEDALSRLEGAKSILPTDEITLAECITLLGLNTSPDDYVAVSLEVSTGYGPPQPTWKIYENKRWHEGHRLVDAYRAWIATKRGADPVKAAVETIAAPVSRPAGSVEDAQLAAGRAADMVAAGLVRCDKCEGYFRPADGQTTAQDVLCGRCISALIPF